MTHKMLIFYEVLEWFVYDLEPLFAIEPLPWYGEMTFKSLIYHLSKQHYTFGYCVMNYLRRAGEITLLD